MATVGHHRSGSMDVLPPRPRNVTTGTLNFSLVGAIPHADTTRRQTLGPAEPLISPRPAVPPPFTPPPPMSTVTSPRPVATTPRSSADMRCIPRPMPPPLSAKPMGPRTSSLESLPVLPPTMEQGDARSKPLSLAVRPSSGSGSSTASTDSASSAPDSLMEAAMTHPLRSSSNGSRKPPTSAPASPRGSVTRAREALLMRITGGGTPDGSGDVRVNALESSSPLPPSPPVLANIPSVPLSVEHDSAVRAADDAILAALLAVDAMDKTAKAVQKAYEKHRQDLELRVMHAAAAAPASRTRTVTRVKGIGVVMPETCPACDGDQEMISVAGYWAMRGETVFFCRRRITPALRANDDMTPLTPTDVCATFWTEAVRNPMCKRCNVGMFVQRHFHEWVFACNNCKIALQQPGNEVPFR